MLRQIGPTLGRPLIDTLNGSRHANMKEPRVGTGDMVIRIAFAFDPVQKAILLIGGDKSGVNQQRFYKQLIKKADELYDDHLKSIGKEVEAKKRAKAGDAKRRGKQKGGSSYGKVV